MVKVWSAEDAAWCRLTVLKAVRESGESPGLYEDNVYQLMAGMSHRDERQEWERLTSGTKAIVVSHSIESLLFTKEIYAAPELTQSTGRRCFRVKNPLDAIVEAL